MCMHCVLATCEGRGHPLSCQHFSKSSIYVLNLFPVGSAENKESSSDVQAEGGKPTGMYCSYYSAHNYYAL